MKLNNCLNNYNNKSDNIRSNPNKTNSITEFYLYKVLTGSSIRSLGVAPKKRTGPAGRSAGNDGPPLGGSGPESVLKLALSTSSKDGLRTFARVLPRDP